MKLKNKILVLSLFLVLICCLGAVSATEDINETITTDSSIDEVNKVPIEDVATVEDTSEKILSDECDNNEMTLSQNSDQISGNVAVTGTPVSVSDWTNLRKYCQYTNDYIISLSGTSYTVGSAITFANSATIIGNDNAYITGGSTSRTPFVNTNSGLTITFVNVHFKNMNVKNLMEMAGTTHIENCTFDNINTASNHNSILWNTNNLMEIIGSNFTNNNVNYGAVTNYKSGSYTDVVMAVENCIFENNTGSAEPGAINNCGILNVTSSEFNYNHASLWAGAIHTHSNAQTSIKHSKFNGNTAGWNGGALFTYSKLDIYNSSFINNNCTTNNGGGAIGGYNYGSTYNITIDSCKFNYNTNLCYAYTNISTTSVGRGGAISVLNGGYLSVGNSNFTGNYAKIGQAIAAATYTYENGTGGNPHIKIYNNRFVNHTGDNDTVYITGNDILFENNTFINSVQTIHYPGVGNVYDLVAMPLSIVISQKSKLGSINLDLLSNDGDKIYVNGSASSSGEGYSWEDALSGDTAIDDAIEYVNDGGTIYIADGDYIMPWAFGQPKTVTFIGQGIKTNLNKFDTKVYGDEPIGVYTFINLTFTGGDFGRASNFINCVFINSKITVAYDLTQYDERVIQEDYAQAYVMNFDKCVFKDFSSNDNLITLYRFGAVTFSNCSFENITAGAIVYHNDTTYFGDDNITFKDCTFSNSKFNGVVDSITNYDDAIAIEDCNYDSEVTVGTTEVNGHFYVNATKLKVSAVETNISISSSEKGIVTITVKDAEGNPVANVEVKYNNGGENITNTTNAEGIVTVTGLTGEGEIKAYFEGNEAYLESNNTYKYNFTETTPTPDTNSSTNGTSTTPAKTTTTTTKVTKKATKITAKKATFKAKKKTKKYTIVLKAGKAAVKKVKVTLKVGKKTYKATTNSKGKATFKITKLNKKGKYNAVIKFAGNKNFKATSKKVKITVKK